MKNWIALFLMTGSLAAAVLLRGGVYPWQWEWSALGISIASGLTLVPAPNGLSIKGRPRRQWGFTILAVLLGWIVVQVAPLPPAVVAFASPHHWRLAKTSDEVAGLDDRAWTAISVAPPATMTRLLDIAPAMAAFIAASQLAWFWRDRLWLVVAPVIGIASLQSIVGLSQFFLIREARGEAPTVSGTYVYHNHFSGLLEIALFPSLWWAVHVWRTGTTTYTQGIVPALKATALTAAAACLLAGIVVSQSRMGFVSTIAAACITFILLLTSSGTAKMRVVAAVLLFVVTAALIVLLPTQELNARFGELAEEQDLAKDARVQIWRNTTHLITDYTWVGVGLGAYEHGLYEYKTAMPNNTVDFAHNDYLQVLAELGIIGTVLLGALVVWVVGRVFLVSLFMRGLPSWELSMGLVGSFVVLGVHSLADFNLYLPANALALAWLAGIAVTLGLKRQRT